MPNSVESLSVSDKIFLKSIGDIYYDLRVESKLTQREAAALAFTCQGQVSKLENGKTDLMVSTLKRWAHIYGYNLEFVLTKIQPEETDAFSWALETALSELEMENKNDDD